MLLEASHPKLVPPEAWFLDAPPTGAELASIVIVCCNALDYTRACVANVLRHSRPPYELIVVDNGSHDETPAFLEQLRQQPGPSRLVVLRNDSNRGYAVGINQGLAHCRGRFLVLLNNDCVVTPGWLEGLIGWSLQRWPRVGLVGPRSNGAPAPQFLRHKLAYRVVQFSGSTRSAWAPSCMIGTVVVNIWTVWLR